MKHGEYSKLDLVYREPLFCKERGGMQTINIHAAKTHLSRLVEQAAGGEPFIIAKAGKPMVRVVPYDLPEPVGKRRLGFLKGRIHLDADVKEIGGNELIRLFEGDA